MNKYFDNQEEHELDETKRTNYGQKVFEMVNGIEVEFGKKKKEEEEKDADGKKTTKRGSVTRWRRNQLPRWFLSRISRVSSGTCHTGRS
jgi:hypothetical protein